jgi:transcription elongation factor Elf1
MNPERRPSMLTIRMRVQWLDTADCPRCGAQNDLSETIKPIELDDECDAKCRVCKNVWTPDAGR